MAEVSAVITSPPDTAHNLVSAFEACAKHDIYWSNEYFYRWLSATPAKPSLWSAFARRKPDAVVEAAGCRFIVKMRHDPSDQLSFLERLAKDIRFPGAAVAWARWLARAGRDQDALAVANNALAGVSRTTLPWDLHILRNQITAIERKIAGKRVHRSIQRYLGDDDGYMSGRTCQFPFERLDLQENGNAAVCCAHWMPGFSLGNVITGTETASQIYNNDKAQSVRRSVLDGSFRYCDHDKCPDISGERLPAKTEAPWANTKHAVETGTLVFESPSIALLAFDSSCNLSCPSCRSHVITEKIDLQTTKEKLIEESIFPLLRGVTTLHINPAGEIFVSRPLRRLLSKLNHRDFPDLKIDMITNGTLFTKREWEKFPGIHGMVRTIRISTDAASKHTFEKLRRGGQWEPFLENMHFLADLRRGGVVESLQFSFTYQESNFGEMPMFAALTSDIDEKRTAIFEKLENWGTFEPDSYRATAVHHLGHPRHEEFLSIIRRPELKPNPPYLVADYEGLL